MRPVSKIETVEIIISTANNQAPIPFPQLEQLVSDGDRDVVIRGIQVYSNQEVPLSFNQNPVSTEAQIASSFLVGFVDGFTSLQSIPLARLRNTYRSGAAAAGQDSFWQAEKLELDNLKVDWSKTKLVFSGSLANGGQMCFLFGIDYMWVPPGSYSLYKQNQWALLSSGVFPK